MLNSPKVGSARTFNWICTAVGPLVDKSLLRHYQSFFDRITIKGCVRPSLGHVGAKKGISAPALPVSISKKCASAVYPTLFQQQHFNMYTVGALPGGHYNQRDDATAAILVHEWIDLNWQLDKYSFFFLLFFTQARNPCTNIIYSTSLCSTSLYWTGLFFSCEKNESMTENKGANTTHFMLDVENKKSVR